PLRIDRRAELRENSLGVRPRPRQGWPPPPPSPHLPWGRPVTTLWTKDPEPGHLRANRPALPLSPLSRRTTDYTPPYETCGASSASRRLIMACPSSGRWRRSGIRRTLPIMSLRSTGTNCGPDVPLLTSYAKNP